MYVWFLNISPAYLSKLENMDLELNRFCSKTSRDMAIFRSFLKFSAFS
jgi:hypothetical protein